MTWDGRILADARHLPIADESVQCVVTSPPYWGLRDYGKAGQIGLERTPEEYVATMVQMFREVWRVLKDDGTLWLNLGDSYAAGGHGGGGSYMKERSQWAWQHRAKKTGFRAAPEGLKPKDLVGIPWRVAFALQADGWWLRSDIIWAKKNCMPESVTDRPTRSHEYIFLLTKSEQYFYNAEAIREPSKYAGPNGAQKSPHSQGFGRRTPEQEKERQDKQRGHSRRHAGFNDRWDHMMAKEQCSLGRNKRDVWHIGTQPYPEAHYAVFPEEIPETCILAGSNPGDVILDPFLGSGTTARVAERLSRRWIGCDLSYQDLQEKRMRNLQKELVAW